MSNSEGEIWAILDVTPGGPRTAAPELGQHTEEVLLEIGYSWDDIVRMKEEQAII